MELVEFAAARRGICEGDVESREPLHQPLDVVGAAFGDGWDWCWF